MGGIGAFGVGWIGLWGRIFVGLVMIELSWRFCAWVGVGEVEGWDGHGMGVFV